MTQTVKASGYWIAGFLFLLFSTVALTKFGSYYIHLMTAIGVISAGIIFYMSGIRTAYRIVFFSLPLSLNLPVFGESQLRFPSELLVIALALAVTLMLIRNPGNFWNRRVTVLLMIWLGLSLVSVFFSEMIVVSAKAVIVKFLYVLAFYGGGYFYFRESETPVSKYYIVPLLAVVAYVFYLHAEFDFSKDAAGYVTKPFFQDHTIYSAALAFMLPLTVLEWKRSTGWVKWFYGSTGVIYLVALFFASSRAAWLSVGIMIVVALLLSLKFPRRGFLLAGLLLIVYVSFNSRDLFWQLKLNRYDSNARHAGLSEQTKSVTNITNDQSNAERINRWMCALRMAAEKPLTGFGPGTYQFVYFPFQREAEMTAISVRSPFNIKEGRGGTAHNEYLLILSESGIATAFFFLLTVSVTLYNGMKRIYSGASDYSGMALMLGFISFIVHSLFNNFLDTDKTAALFFMTLAFFSSVNPPRHGYKS